MERKQKGILIVSLIALVLMAIGITYAYFTASIEGRETASTVVVTGGIMQIEYSENSNVILMENIYPRPDAWVTKTITITGTNTTDLQMKYDLGLNVINNTFSHYLSYDLTLLEGDNGTPIANVTNKALVGTGYKRFGIGVFNNANSAVHKYELKIYLKDNNINQNEVQNGVFNAKVVIEEAGINDPNEEVAMFLTGTEVNIKMKQLAGDDTSSNGATTLNTTITSIQRSNTLKDGLTDNNIVSTSTSTKPIYMWYEDGTIYYYTEAKNPSLNNNSSNMFRTIRNLNDISGLSDINASTAINMRLMFLDDLSLTSLHGLENWDTSNVTNMEAMFMVNGSTYYYGYRTRLSNINALSNWDTSKVTIMGGMFQNNTSLTSLEGLENWDTSNVTYMANMFAGLTVTNLHGLENWDTSSVTSMKVMFYSNTSLTNISAISNWNVSNVIDFDKLFSSCTSLTDASAINDWNIKPNAIFTEMFGAAPSHPNFTKLPGTWNSSGTFTPNS